MSRVIDNRAVHIVVSEYLRNNPGADGDDVGRIIYRMNHDAIVFANDRDNGRDRSKTRDLSVGYKHMHMPADTPTVIHALCQVLDKTDVKFGGTMYMRLKDMLQSWLA